ncbi:hypothetical protein [Hyphococcus luteus]
MIDLGKVSEETKGFDEGLSDHQGGREQQ